MAFRENKELLRFCRFALISLLISLAEGGNHAVIGSIVSGKSTLLPQNVFTGYLTQFALAQYDRVPEDIAENRWENLLTTENKRININQGVRSFDLNDLKQHTIDSRIFVYVHRNDNYVKPEAVITGGYFTDTTVFGDLVLSKK